MALTTAIQLSYSKNGRIIQVQPLVYTVTPTGNGAIDGVILVPFASAISIPITGLTTPDVAVFTNLNATNYISLGYDDTGFVSVMRINPLASVAVSLVGLMSVPYAQADTADCLLSYTIIDA